MDGPLHLARGDDVDALDAGGRGERHRPGDQHHPRAAPRGLGGEGEAHLAARPVAEEADGIDRLVGGTGGDQHRAPGAAAPRRRRPRPPRTISSGSAIRPIPTSPEASGPSTGPTNRTPRRSQGLHVLLRRWPSPTSTVCMAGATTSGPAKASAVVVRKSSREPQREACQHVGGRRGHAQHLRPGARPRCAPPRRAPVPAARYSSW